MPTKPPKSSPFSHRFGRRIKGKRTTKGSCIHPSTNAQENSLEISPRKNAKKGLRKSPKRMNRNNTSKPRGTAPNHLYITKRFIPGLAYCPIIHPSHKISS
jgi:hypothetical protein